MSSVAYRPALGKSGIAAGSRYSFVMAFVGGGIASLLAGAEQTQYLVLIGFCVVIGAGIWGQFWRNCRSTLS
jgi:hypothetical protein